MLSYDVDVVHRRADSQVGGRTSQSSFFFFQAEDGIRDLVRSRGLGDVYKRQVWCRMGRLGDQHRARPGYDHRDFLRREIGGFQELSLIHI